MSNLTFCIFSVSVQGQRDLTPPQATVSLPTRDLPRDVEEHRLEEEREADPLVVLVAHDLLVLARAPDTRVGRHAVVVVQDPPGQRERRVDPEEAGFLRCFAQRVELNRNFFFSLSHSTTRY